MLRVLIADKPYGIADSLAKSLAQYGYKTTAAYGGQNAVEIAAVLRPDVFISEVMMSGMTGIEAGILVRLMLPLCRVLLFAEQGLAASLFERARAQGHDFEVIPKPVEPRILVALLNRPPVPNVPERTPHLPRPQTKLHDPLKKRDPFKSM